MTYNATTESRDKLWPASVSYGGQLSAQKSGSVIAHSWHIEVSIQVWYCK